MKKVPSFLLCRLLNCGRVPIFASQSRTKASQIGRLAQLVQSVCLTSRGSGVRIPQRPHSKKRLRRVASFFIPSRFDSELRRGVCNARERARTACQFFGMPRLLSSQILAQCGRRVGERERTDRHIDDVPAQQKRLRPSKERSLVCRRKGTVGR